MERPGVSLEAGLLGILRDPKLSQQDRAVAAELLGMDGGARGVEALLVQFYAQSEQWDVYMTALALEQLGDRRAVVPLIRALQDENPHRRTGAARALGWMRQPSRALARALAECLLDRSQLLETREEAAESLSYVGTRETVEALIAVLGDPEPRVRFWAVFGLGGICRRDERATRALETMLEDPGEMPGYYSVGLEALAVLRNAHHRFEGRWQEMRQRITADEGATEAQRRWVEWNRF
jgi:HEAT repeat protein